MNITLIGMPGAGKSTAGVILAKIASMEFVDTDILIQMRHKKTLQDIIDSLGHLELRIMEEEIIYFLDVVNCVIATGGSAIYSKKAMLHLKNISKIVFLKVSYKTLIKRITDFDTRGLAKSKEQTFLDLFNERNPMYEKYADITLNCDEISQEEAAKRIAELVEVS